MDEPSRWRAASCAVIAVASLAGVANAQSATLPVIDMHAHAGRIRSATPVPVCPGNEPMILPALDPKDRLPATPLMQCARPILSPTSSDALKYGTIAELRRHNVRRAVLAGTPELVRDWGAAAPGLFIPAAVPSQLTRRAIAQLRTLHSDGGADVFA